MYFKPENRGFTQILNPRISVDKNQRAFALKSVFPKKRLGQHFLVDKNIQNKIINACEFKTSDIVLEIGAGVGQLTRLIADRVSLVYAVEVDPYLSSALVDNLKGNKNVRIITKDILKFNLKRYFGKLKNKINPAPSYTNSMLSNRRGGIKVIGNIPYYITSPIIEHLLEYRDKIDTIFITVQKEFARRMIACPGSKEYGSLSCFVQYYAKAKILFLIKRTSFSPSPKVDSCFVRLKIEREPQVKINNEKFFFKIIRAAFNQRRKTLRNSLRGIVSMYKLRVFFDQYDIDVNIRPEDLYLEDFANLTNI